jgi:outer membrane protein TolC
MKQPFLFILCFLIGTLGAQAQPKSLSQQQLLEIVKLYHPVARQAALNIDIAKDEVRVARGAFDPSLQMSGGRKELEGVLYYDQAQYEVKIPVWYGIDIYAGMESLYGNKTNPTETKGASSYIGFSIPVVKNLFMDKRRAALKQAQVFEDMSAVEQQVVLNNLLQEASKAYWDWWEQYAVYQLFTAAMSNAEKRLQMVRTTYQVGERPAIDTLEALTQLQSFRLQQNEIGIRLNQARLELSVYLWQKESVPYELPAEVVPQIAPASLPEPLQSEENLLQATANHPQLQQYQYKLKALQIDRRLKFQSLLPSVNLKYNQLYHSHNIIKNFSTPWLDNNYRYGIAVSMPLRLSEGRGEYRKANLKIEQARLEQVHKKVAIENKVRQYYFEWQQLQQQVSLQQQAVNMLQNLQRGEEQKFFNGESSLFLINSREAKTLESQQKLLELQSKHQKSMNNTLWAAGLLIQ